MAAPSYSIAGAQKMPLQTRIVGCTGHQFITEKIFTVAMLFYTTGAVVPLISGAHDPSAPPQTSPMDLAIKVVLYTIAFFFIALRWRSFVQSVWNIKWILVPVLIAIVSTVWSQYPSFTVRGSAVLLATTAFGVYFGVRYTIPQQLRLLAWAFFFVLIISFFFAIFIPMYGIDGGSNSGDWRGAFLYKNVLAEIAVLAFLVFLFVRPRTSRSLRWFGIAASLALLFLSGSATGIIVCFAIVATLPLYKLAHARWTLVIPVTLGLSLLLAGSLLVMKTGAAESLQLMNRGPDLTGRTELWNAVLISISKRPWLGYGFSAFWEGMNGESESVLKAAGWMAGYAHDGFLDLLLQLGFLGLVTFVAGYLVLWRRALAFLSRATGPAPLWLCAFLAFMLLYNLTEGSSILAQNTIYWILYIAAAVNLIPVSSRQADTKANQGGQQTPRHISVKYSCTVLARNKPTIKVNQ